MRAAAATGVTGDLTPEIVDPQCTPQNTFTSYNRYDRSKYRKAYMASDMSDTVTWVSFKLQALSTSFPCSQIGQECQSVCTHMYTIVYLTTLAHIGTIV